MAPPPTGSAEAAELRPTFSFALRYCLARRGGARGGVDVAAAGGAAPTPREHAAAQLALHGMGGGLRLWLQPSASPPAPALWVAYPPAADGLQPVLADDDRKAAHLHGLPFGALRVLTHTLPAAANATTTTTAALSAPSAVAATDAPRFAQPWWAPLLQTIDAGLLRLLRVRRLSSADFSLSAARRGTAVPLPEAAARLRALVYLLQHMYTPADGREGGGGEGCDGSDCSNRPRHPVQLKPRLRP